MDETQLKTILEAEIDNALGYIETETTEQRRRALQFYNREPFGNEVEGRSQIVTGEVAESIDSALPALLRVFTQGDDIVRAEASGPGDEQLAKQITEYLNYVFYRDNPGFSVLNIWFKDALLQKNGVVKAWWDDQKDIQNVYLLYQNYSHGAQVARYAKENLARKRPDVQIVGEDLHPLGQVRDFAPYIAKIKASGADTVITGNWGSDLSLLVKAANEGGYNGKFYTYYTGVTGTPTALGTNGAGRVFQIAYSHYNMGGQMAAWSKEFNEKYNDDHYTHSVNRIFEALGAAMAKAKSTDPVKVAAALEGLQFKTFNGEVEMRKVDHQLQQPLYMTVWQKADAKFPYSPEKTGMTLVPVKEFPNYVSSTPTSCQMKRP
jgi:branched-chain amino acid transport system substrate-binding protein